MPANLPPEHVMNVLLLLHGLGDCEEPFHKLASTMNLPQTVAMSLKGPVPVLSFGFSWFSVFDLRTAQELSSEDQSKGLLKVAQELASYISELNTRLTLSASPSMLPKRFFLLGFGQGASVCLETGLLIASKHEVDIAGVMCLSGTFMAESWLSKWTDPGPFPQPLHVFASHGIHDEKLSIGIARNRVERLKSLACIGDVDFHEYAKGCQMLCSREETKDLMAWLGGKMLIGKPPPLSTGIDTYCVSGQRPAVRVELITE